MTELYLQKTGTAEWQRVWPDTAQAAIRLTRENPYFTQSESYTLDVTLPMDIIDNRRFFRNMQRMERSRQPEAMKCRLMVDNAPALCGSAKVTQVTESLVKVQLLGGRSEVNFLAEDSGDFIDELPLGTIPKGSTATDSGVRMAASPVNNETTGGGGTAVWQFCLVDIARMIIAHYGFTVTSCSVDAEPWDRLFVATAKQTRDVAHVLPHWSPREFFTEFCNFFNVSLDIDEVRRTVAIVGTPAFFAARRRVQLEPVDEYTADIGEEAHALAADDISYDLSSSPEHDYDCIPDNVRRNAPSQQYASHADALAAYQAMTEQARKRQLFRCPEGTFAAWEHDYADWGEQQPRQLFTQIDVLAPLTRDGNAGETSLKICPAAIAMGEYEGRFGQGEAAHTYTTCMFLPSVENPTGHDTILQATQYGNFGGSTAEQQQQEEGATIQEFIEGEAELEAGAGKEDRLQVIFIDDVPQTYSRVDSASPSTYEERTHIVGFTDHQYKKSHRGNAHRRWSLSLNPTDADHYLGQLHVNGFSFNMKARHTFRFVADRMPDPRDIFIVRGKRYGCEKMEATVNADGFDRLMTGYFYEML